MSALAPPTLSITQGEKTSATIEAVNVFVNFWSLPEKRRSKTEPRARYWLRVLR
jgi:hypothetical protein